MSSNHDVLGFVLPTNEPDTFFKFFLSSLHNLKEVAPLSTILLNFQEPWTQDKIDEAVSRCKELGFRVLYTYNNYEIKGKGLIPINKIRNDSCLLLPTAKYFALVDDDFTFQSKGGVTNKSAGEQYVDVLDYLTSHPECGIFIFGGSLYKSMPTNCIGPADLENTYITGKGLIFKNTGIKGSEFLPEGCLDLVGSDEERVLSAFRLSQGLYPAKMRCSRIRHYENHKSKNKDTPLDQSQKVNSGSTMYDWDATEILEANNNKFIKDNYYPNLKLNRKYKLCDPDEFIAKGGIDVYDKSVRDKYTTDYTSSDYKLLIESIIRRLG